MHELYLIYLPKLKQQLMKIIHIIAIISIFIFLAEARRIQGNSSCKTSSSNCDFYKCLENKNKCGSNGYPLSYGYKYCMKFANNNYKTQNAKNWTNDVRKCLQDQLNGFSSSKSKNMCSTIENDAFNSHPYCYTKYGICYLVKECLNPSNSQAFCPDVATIIKTVDINDMISSKSVKQILSTLSECTKRAIPDKIKEFVHNIFNDDDDISLLETKERMISFFEDFEKAKIAKKVSQSS